MAAPIPDHLSTALDSLSLHALTLATPKKLPPAGQATGTRRLLGSRTMATPDVATRESMSPAKRTGTGKRPGIVTRLNLAKAEGTKQSSRESAHHLTPPTPIKSEPEAEAVEPILSMLGPSDAKLIETVDLTADDEDVLDEVQARRGDDASLRRKGRVSVFGLVGDAAPMTTRDAPLLVGSSSSLTLCGTASSREDTPSGDAESPALVSLADELFPPSPPRTGPTSPVGDKPASPVRRRITVIDLDPSDSDDDGDVSATSCLRRTPPRGRPSLGLTPTKPKPRPSEVLAEARDEGSSGEDDAPTRRRGKAKVVISDSSSSSSSEDDDGDGDWRPRSSSRSPETELQRRRSPRLSEPCDPDAGVLQQSVPSLFLEAVALKHPFDSVPAPKNPKRLAPLTPKHQTVPSSRPPKTAPVAKTKPFRAAPPPRSTSNPLPAGKPPAVVVAKPSTGAGPLTGRAFVLKRDLLAAHLVATLDATVFSNRLPPCLRIVWSKRLLTTAGRASWRRKRCPKTGGTVREEAEVELATKVVDDEQKLANTLAHELCHIAAFALDGEMTPPHGPAFKAWARRIHRSRPDIEITVSHSYQIQFRYRWQCLDPLCGHVFGRHSKSIDPSRQVCSCGSRLAPIPPQNPSSSRAKPSAGAGRAKTGRDAEGDELARAVAAIELE